ncbi:MAG: hypothetical protein OXJ90_24830 [Spirochaetaceae bacterium]|nr:hypothetical protein [Spirochaetaceae bacterium]
MPALGDSVIFDLLHYDNAVERIRFAVEKLDVDVNGRIKDGAPMDTPLCKAPTVAVARELVRLGAGIRARGDESQTLFHCAIRHGRDPNLIGWLRDELGLDIDQPNKDGITPLCSAAKHHGVVEVTALLDNGADPTATTRDPSDPSIEQSTLACALTNRRPWSEVTQIIEVLESAGSAAPVPSETTDVVLPGAHPLVMAYLIIVSDVLPAMVFRPFFTPPDALDAVSPIRLPEPPQRDVPHPTVEPLGTIHPVMLAVAPMGSPDEPQPPHFGRAPAALTVPPRPGHAVLLVYRIAPPVEPPHLGNPPPPTLPPRTVVGVSREGSSDFRGVPSTPTARLTTRSGQPITFAVNEVDRSRPSGETYRLAVKPRHGAVTIDEGASITYAPKRGAVGSDEFVVEALRFGGSAEQLLLLVENDLSFEGTIAGYAGSLDDVDVLIEGSGVLRTTTPDEAGVFRFYELPDGHYALKIRAAGYRAPASREFTLDIDRHDALALRASDEFVLTELDTADESSFVYHWEADQTTAGYEYAAHVNKPPQIDLLDQPIALADESSAIQLLHDYNIRLVDSPSGEWTQEHAYRLLHTMKSIPQPRRDSYDRQNLAPSAWILASDHVAHDILVDNTGSRQLVTVSEDAFANAAPRVALIEGKRGRYYSQRLHHALVRFVTANGTDERAFERILQERYGLTTRVPDYLALTAHTTGGEPPTRFQKFHSEEVVRLINMLEELPRGMHKIPELRFLVRRLNGTPHPVYPQAPAVAWPDDGYIEFMEDAFRTASDSQIHRLIIHEKAHFLWAHLFDDRLRQDWIELGGWYRNDNASSGWSTSKQTEFVSAYAHDENPNEDMAESIAYFVVNPDKLRSRSPAKYEFIRDRVMQGSVYLSRIREDLTFKVYNLFPDYVFPGKIRRVDIRVEGGPKDDKAVEVEIELHASDPVTEGATHAQMRIFSEIGTWVDLGLHPVDDHGRRIPDRGAGIVLKGDFTLDKFAKAGYWAPDNIRLTDAHGNERLEGSEDFGWQLYIDNPLEDVTPPQYVKDTASLHVSSTIRNGRNVQLIHATWRVEEDKDMRDQWACFAMLNDTIPETYRVEEYGHYDRQRGLCEVDFLMPHYMPSSVYSMNHIIMFDQARNTRGVYFTDPDHGLRPEDLVVDEPPQRIELVTTDPDLVPPEIDVNRISVSATPVHPDAPDGETIVTVTYHVRDEGSGYRKAALYLRDPQGIEHHHWAVHDWSEFFDGDPSEWTAYMETVVLPRGSAPGTWGLAEMTVWDKAGNIHRYDFTEIVHVDLDCETEGKMSAGGKSAFSAVLVAAVTKVPCLPTFKVVH